jgi:hypothetical protein
MMREATFAGQRRHPALAVALACLGPLPAAGGASAAGHLVSLSVRVQPSGSSRILINGRVMPAPRNGRIEVQVHRSQGWEKFVGGRLRRGGGFRLSREGTGELALRVRVLQGKRLLGTSKVRRIEVKAGAPNDGSAGAPSAGGSLGSGGIGGPPATPVPHC